MTKIDIISGFLGAGKTTFIKKLLQEAISGEQVVLIENEFGEIGIDGGFLKDSGIEIREMNSGCICCSLVGDFGKSLSEVLTKYKPDRIIIEPSGVGKLSDVMKAVIDVSADMDVALNSAVTIVDAAKCKMYMKNFGEFFNNQIENAGTVVLSRTDITDTAKIQKDVEMIREKNPKAAIVTTPLAELGGSQLLEIIEKRDTMLDDLLEEVRESHHHHDDDDDDCCCGHNLIMSTITTMITMMIAAVAMTTIMSIITIMMKTKNTNITIIMTTMTIAAVAMTMIMSIITIMMKTKNMNITIIMTTTMTAAVAMTMITNIIITIMQTKYSPAGVWRPSFL